MMTKLKYQLRYGLIKKIAALALLCMLIGEHAAQNIMSVSPAESDNSVAAELRSFKVAEEYNIELFASEKLGIANPVAMRWDEKGRL